MKAFAKLTEEVDGEPRIVSDPPLIVPIRGARRASGIEVGSRLEARAELFRDYRRTLQRDRRKLLERFRYRRHRPQGRRRRQRRHALLDRAAARPRRRRPALPPGQGGAGVGARAVSSARAGTRTTASASSTGQRLMQAASDIFLGWMRADDGLDGVARDFYVRQLWDWKGSVDARGDAAAGPRRVREVCGWTLARAHARSGDRGRDRRPTSARATRSTGRSPSSRPPTPTRTSATTRRSRSRGSRPHRGPAGI